MAEPSGSDRGSGRVIVGRRGTVWAGVGAFFANAALVYGTGASLVAKLLSSVFMGAFTCFGMRLLGRIRLNLRPEFSSPDKRNASETPVQGGWANPTRMQTLVARIKRLVSKP